jgi:hypothetical protein
MGFGKRPSSAPAPASATPDSPASRQAPPFVVDPRETNLSPDSSDQARVAMEARHAQLQLSTESLLPGAKMRPFLLIPDSCWDGPTGTFLMKTLDLYAHDNWNVMFLAADERTAAALDIALHPNSAIPAFVQAAERLMDECQLNMNGAHNEAARTGDFNRYHEARDDAREQVKLLAGQFAKQIVEAWQKRSAGRGA